MHAILLSTIEMPVDNFFFKVIVIIVFTFAQKALKSPFWPFQIQSFVLKNHLLTACLCNAMKDCEKVKAEVLRTLKNRCHDLIFFQNWNKNYMGETGMRNGCKEGAVMRAQKVYCIYLLCARSVITNRNWDKKGIECLFLFLHDC